MFSIVERISARYRNFVFLPRSPPEPPKRISRALRVTVVRVRCMFYRILEYLLKRSLRPCVWFLLVTTLDKSLYLSPTAVCSPACRPAILPSDIRTIILAPISHIRGSELDDMEEGCRKINNTLSRRNHSTTKTQLGICQ
jgi:hypothetical protein